MGLTIFQGSAKRRHGMYRNGLFELSRNDAWDMSRVDYRKQVDELNNYAIHT